MPGECARGSAERRCRSSTATAREPVRCALGLGSQLSKGPVPARALQRFWQRDTPPAREEPMPFDQILVPLDGSLLAEAALPKAVEIIGSNAEATLILLRTAAAATVPGVDPNPT